MKAISRKLPVLLSLLLIWVTASGFEGIEDLDVETTAGIESVMDDLTGEDFEKLQIEEEWEEKVLANVEDYVTVRSEPNAESTALGRMFKGDGGEVVERLEGWTRVQSGNVNGYVNNDYLLFGYEAYEQAQEEVTLTATSLTGGLRIRSEASTEAKILKNVGEGTKLDVVEGEETEGAEWIHIQYAEEKTGYVSAEYVSVEFELGEAMTMDEIKKKEAEEKREKLKQQLDAIKANGNEVTLLAALIQAEGGNQPYDGQVAIGAVVMQGGINTLGKTAVSQQHCGCHLCTGAIRTGKQRNHYAVYRRAEGKLHAGGAGGHQRIYHNRKLYPFQTGRFRCGTKQHRDWKPCILLRKNRRLRRFYAPQLFGVIIRHLLQNLSEASLEP